MTSDISYAAIGYTKNGGADVPARFGYDHGNMLIESKAGKRDLLFAHDGDNLRRNACRALWHLSPDVSRELIRGYRLARAAGLLNDGECNREVAIAMSRLDDTHAVGERIDDGKRQMVALVEVLRKENYKAGGVQSS